MTTPAPVEPPTPENVHLYRAAVLAWRKAEIEELRRHDGNHKLANPHVANHVAARAVHALAPEAYSTPKHRLEIARGYGGRKIRCGALQAGADR